MEDGLGGQAYLTQLFMVASVQQRRRNKVCHIPLSVLRRKATARQAGLGEDRSAGHELSAITATALANRARCKLESPSASRTHR